MVHLGDQTKRTRNIERERDPWFKQQTNSNGTCRGSKHTHTHTHKEKKKLEIERPMIQITKISKPLKVFSSFHYLPMLLLTMAPNPSCWGLARNFLATKRGSVTTLWLSFSGIFFLLELGNLECKIRGRWNEFIRNGEEGIEKNGKSKRGKKRKEEEEVGCQRRLEWVKIWYERAEFDERFFLFWGFSLAYGTLSLLCLLFVRTSSWRCDEVWCGNSFLFYFNTT